MGFFCSYRSYHVCCGSGLSVHGKLICSASCCHPLRYHNVCSAWVSLQSQAFLGKCPHPSCNDSEVGSEMSDDEEVHFHFWNQMLELFTLQGSSPVLQYDLEDWEVCRVALSCHFALDIIFAFTVRPLHPRCCQSGHVPDDYRGLRPR